MEKLRIGNRICKNLTNCREFLLHIHSTNSKYYVCEGICHVGVDDMNFFVKLGIGHRLCNNLANYRKFLLHIHSTNSKCCDMWRSMPWGNKVLRNYLETKKCVSETQSYSTRDENIFDFYFLFSGSVTFLCKFVPPISWKDCLYPTKFGKLKILSNNCHVAVAQASRLQYADNHRYGRTCAVPCIAVYQSYLQNN